jgi:hypothetical protein
MSGENSSTGGLSTTLQNWFSADPSSMSPATAQKLGAVGNMMAITGAINGIIGTYYSSKTQKYQFESMKLSYELQKDMAEINARMAEGQAQAILLAGENQKAQIGLRAGKIKAGTRASMAARGITLGVGSAAENIATIDLVKEIDSMTVNYNSTRAAIAARSQKVNYETSAAMAGISASGAGASASQVSPFGNAAMSLVGGATSIAQSWYNNYKQNQIYSQLAAAKGG